MNSTPRVMAITAVCEYSLTTNLETGGGGGGSSEGWMERGKEEREQQLTRPPGGAFESGVPGKASITVSPSASNPR